MKRLSLRGRLTVMTAALVAAACLLLNLFISRSAVTGIQKIETYVVEVAPDGQEAFRLDMGSLYPNLQEQLHRTTDLFRWQSLLATLAVILFASTVTWFLAGRGLAPLKTFSAHMETIQAKNLSEPLEIPETGDEIARLAQSFNHMLFRLEQAFSVQRQFAASAAHELRTPLAVVQTRLDVLQKKDVPSIDEYAKVLKSVGEETERLSHVVELLLEMTELESAERDDEISLSALTEEVLCDLAQVAEEKQISLCQEGGGACLLGSDVLLYRAVYNLVENGIKYGRPGGKVTVRVRMEGQTAVVEVADTGIGIDAENWERIFEPFVRVDKAKSRAMGGAGLGLALVRNIARLHGGTVQVAESSRGGTTMVLRLPAGR